MTVHRYHPDPDRDSIPDAQLFDECDRCDEQANDLHGLDSQKLAWFWSVMVSSVRDEYVPGRPMTQNEHRAVERCLDMATIFERLTGVWPTPKVLIVFKDAIDCLKVSHE